MVAPGLIFVPVAGAVRFYGGEEALAERLAEEIERVGGPGPGWAGADRSRRWAIRRSLGSCRLRGWPAPGGDRHHRLPLPARSDRAQRRSRSRRVDRHLSLARGVHAGRPGPATQRRPGHPFREPWPARTSSGHRRGSVRRPTGDPTRSGGGCEFRGTVGESGCGGFRLPCPGGEIAPGLCGCRGWRRTGSRSSPRMPPAGSRERIWRSADPFTEKALSDRVWWQLRAWVEAGGIPGGISRLRIAPADLSDEGRQLGLLQDETSRIEAERALARAQSLLGPDGVLQGRAQGGRMPQERVAWSRWGEPPSDRERDDSCPLARGHPFAQPRSGPAQPGAVGGGMGRWHAVTGPIGNPMGAGAHLERAMASERPLVGGGGGRRPLPVGDLGGGIPLCGHRGESLPGRGVRLTEMEAGRCLHRPASAL